MTSHIASQPGIFSAADAASLITILSDFKTTASFEEGRYVVPRCLPSELGDASFRRDYGLKYALYGGSMANGISSAALVEALAGAGMMGFFGAAGTPFHKVEEAIDRMSVSLAGKPFGFNMIHSPSEPEREMAVSELYIKKGVRLVEASAYLGVTLPLVRYRVAGIRRAADGSIETPNRVIGKVSRVEVAEKFFSPPPDKMLAELVVRGDITQEQAALASNIPVAQDVTAEADSGGHTDNRPAITLLPTIAALRDRMAEKYSYPFPLRVGLGGGIATPQSAAGAFCMGAAYLVTGSVNQACRESGTSDAVRQILAEAGQADVMMAPAADMFEMGVRVQVLKRGTMFAMRAQKLYELYKSCPSLEAVPADDRVKIENEWFRLSFEEVWARTAEFFEGRDKAQLERARRDPKHRMALVFRWYLSQTSRWPINGDAERKLDYQVWAGPALGAFNEWTKGTFLAAPSAREAALVNLNLLCGAAYFTRLGALRAQGAAVPPRAAQFAPKTYDELAALAA